MPGKIAKNFLKTVSFISSSPSATLRLGRSIGERLEEGSIIALIGELGCGKTLMTRGICMGLGVSERLVNSPTFAFVNEYQGRLPVFHIDLYRLDNLTEELGIGILDYLNRGASGVIIVEWAEKMRSLLPESYLEVQFEVLAARTRRIVLTGKGDRFIHLIEELNLI
jgi:tRNA threonylcarbamoyladenosine biosynthesis protein TsaE